MKKRLLSVLMVTCMTAGLMAGCGSSDSADEASDEDGKTTITVYLGGDAADENQNIIDTFNEQSETTQIDMVTLTEGSSGYEMLTVMYNAGNPPTVYFLEAGDVMKLTDKLADLSSLECVQYANEGTTEDVTVDGVLYGIPANLQAYGIMYNERVLKNVMGDDFDPSTIRTRDDFREVCEQVEAAGITPVAISPFDWNLGNHWINQIYSGQSEDKVEKDSFIDSLYEGTADLANNAVFNDYMDTFDLLMEYNYYKDNPLETVAGGNEDQAQLMALDEVAFWFHGNWATANIRTLDEEGNYGFIPVPVSEDNPNFGKICTLVPGYFCVESSIATEEQQEAAKEFLNWLITSEEGQQYVVNCGNIPAYSNNEAEIGESVSRSAVEYTSSGETFPMYVQYPSDHATNIGASMQQYLAGEIDRTALAQQISDYWTAQN